MAALCAWLATIIVVPLYLLLDAISDGYLFDQMYAPTPLVDVSWVLATLFYLSFCYASVWLAARTLLRISRDLVAAGQPPAWAERLTATERFISWDYGGWPNILIILALLSTLATLPALVFGQVSPVSWTLLALAVPTLVALQRSRTQPPPLPAGTHVARREPVTMPPPSPEALLAQLRAAAGYRGQLRSVLRVPAHPGGHTAPGAAAAAWRSGFKPGGLLASVIASLGLPGVDALYPQQQQALALLLTERDPAGTTRNLVLTTGPGSGKHLTIFLAALDRTLLRGGNVLFVAPDDGVLEREYARFRDLAEQTDWHYALHEWKLHPSDIGNYPDPPPELLFCTLETLHNTLLRDNAGWREFFDGLDLLVAYDIDGYTGIRGANAAQVFRRLNLVAAEHRRLPQVLATAQPAAALGTFAAQLFGRTPPAQQFDVLAGDSAPRPEQTFALWQAPGGEWPSAAAHEHILAELLEVTGMLAPGGAARVLVYLGRQGDGRPLQVSDAYYAQLAQAAGAGTIRLIDNDLDLSAWQAEHDVLLVPCAPADTSMLMRLAGQLGRDRQGGLCIALIERAPAAQALGEAANHQIERLLPLRVDHPLVFEKHLGCAALETRLTRQRILTTFGSAAPAYADVWVAAGQARYEAVLVDDEGAVRWDHALLVEPAQADLLYQRCRLDTLGFDDLTPIVGPAGTPLGYVDAARAALTLIEGRVVVPGPQPLVLQGGDGRQAHAVVADPAGAPQITPLYTVTFAGAAPSEGAAAPAMPEGARLVRRFGAERRIDVYRLNAAIQQTLAGIRATRAGRPGFVTNMEPPRMAQYTSDGCLVALVGADPDQAAGIAHTLQHALEQVLRAVVPSGILEGERHVLELPALRVDEQQVPAILLTDGVDGGLGLGALLSNSIEDMLTAAQRVLLACPCREGCAACLGNPSCSVAHWAANCRALLAKQATLQFLGAALSTPAPAGLGPTRYTPLSSEPLLAQLRDRVLHEALYPLLGAPPDDYIPPPARFMDHDELAQHDLAGLYLQNDPWRDVVVRPALEEDLVATLAHLYTHDWQFRLADDGQPHMEPTHCDPSQVPLDGRLLREGVAQWVERYALDALGYALPPGRPTFRIFNDHHEGYRIVDTLVRQQGVNGLLHFLHAPFSAENLARLASTAGVDGALSLLRRQAAAGTLVLPPDDIVSVSAAEQATTQPTSATEP